MKKCRKWAETSRTNKLQAEKYADVHAQRMLLELLLLLPLNNDDHCFEKRLDLKLDIQPKSYISGKKIVIFKLLDVKHFKNPYFITLAHLPALWLHKAQTQIVKLRYLQQVQKIKIHHRKQVQYVMMPEKVFQIHWNWNPTLHPMG